MSPLPVLLLFLAVPLVEIYFLIKVGSMIGALTTVVLVVLTAVIGASLARYQGLVTLQRVQATLARGEAPAIEMLEGVILFIGAVLLLTPGFVTDLAGFACLVPPLRRSIALWALQHVIVPPPPPGGPGSPTGSRETRTLEGEYRREDD
jgi:UPF0716 protein FxsA